MSYINYVIYYVGLADALTCSFALLRNIFVQTILKRIKYIKRIINHRRCKKHAVEPVHYAAVSRYKRPVILDAHLALEYRSCKVSELRNDASGNAYNRILPELQPVAYREEIPEQHAEHNASEYAADRALYSFFRAYHRAQLVFSQEIPAEIREYISAERGYEYKPYRRRMQPYHAAASAEK